MIRCLLIDDERLARADLRLLLEEFDDFTIVGEAADGEAGIHLINRENPDIIFLDIQMPELSGFEMLEKLEFVPRTIFTTAFDQYAIKSFEYNVLDYLLKPIRIERMKRALDKVRLEIQEESDRANQKKLLDQNRQVFIKDGDNCHFVKVRDIEYIESIGNYARFYFNGQKAMLKRSLNNLEVTLDPTTFFRANRKEMINTNFISSIQPKAKSSLRITLSSGATIDVNERRAASFKARMSL